MHRVIGERSITETAIPYDLAREILSDMVLAREFDRRAVALQRRGWMSGYPPFEGQEASQVGAARALDDADWLFPTYRSNAMQLARGRPVADVLAFRRGRSEFDSAIEPAGDDGAGDGDENDHGDDAGRKRAGRTFTQATPIATQLPHAVGAAMAADDGEAAHAVLAYFGDGATSEGDFHEAMNVAGVFDAPVVFFCENNYWAISTAADRQTASESLAAKAGAYGFDGVRVDGMDPLAVYEAVREARATAVAGEPVMVESLTYRHGAHTTSDDPDRYRGEVDLPDWRTADPVERYASFLRREGVIDDGGETRGGDGDGGSGGETGDGDGVGGDRGDGVGSDGTDGGFVADARAAAAEVIDEAVAVVEAAPDPDPGEIFDDAYASIPPRVARQRAAVTARSDAEPSGSDGA